jgi:CTP synthase (UTP-ammonia lyase)
MQPSTKIGIIGDFNPKNSTHLATNDAIFHAAEWIEQDVVIEWVSTHQLTQSGAGMLASFQGLWGAPGSPYVSMEGALAAIRFAREANIPFFGT